MAARNPNDNSRTYHTDFASPEADVTLRSLDGTHFRMHSYTLRTTSGLFRTMFSLPQESPCVAEDSEPIPVPATTRVLEVLLRIISGVEIPKWESYDLVEDVLALAESWDSPGPLSIVRSAITSPFFLSQPLRLYTLVTQFDWEDEAKLASKLTLTISLHDEQHRSTLERMSAKQLLPLLNLHRRRRDEFKQQLDSPDRFTAGNTNPFQCSGCGVTPLDNHTWRELKTRMIMEMDRRPSGDCFGVLDMADWPEAEACWQAKCQKEGCGTLNYDKSATLNQIKNCVEALPTTI